MRREFTYDDGYDDGYEAGLMQGMKMARKMDMKPTRRTTARRKTPKKTRTLSKWQKYVKQPKNKILYKSGKDKGKLNFKAMGRAFRKKNK